MVDLSDRRTATLALNGRDDSYLDRLGPVWEKCTASWAWRNYRYEAQIHNALFLLCISSLNFHINIHVHAHVLATLRAVTDGAVNLLHSSKSIDLQKHPPHIISGDFDSAKLELLEFYRQQVRCHSASSYYSPVLHLLHWCILTHMWVGANMTGENCCILWFCSCMQTFPIFYFRELCSILGSSHGADDTDSCRIHVMTYT